MMNKVAELSVKKIITIKEESYLMDCLLAPNVDINLKRILKIKIEESMFRTIKKYVQQKMNE